MCGIAGRVRMVPNAGEGVGPMLHALQHRGPDGVDEWSDDHCSLGQCRLAIIDLSEAGQAPLSNEDGTIWLTFNGEIYNFQELRRNLSDLGHSFRSEADTEVIVHAYEEWGTASVERLRGMFAFAVWDQKKQRLFLARDRVGKKPLFYTHTGGQFFFASELQGLLPVSDVAGEVDRAAIHSYLSWGYIPAPLTGFLGVRKLPPATWMTVDLGQEMRQEIRRYWSLSYLPKSEITAEEGSARLREVLTEAVRLRMISDVPLGAFLSGGVDSSIVVGLMAELSSSPVKTFSIGFDDADYNELRYARKVAQHFGTEHHEHIVRPDALEILPTLVRHFGEPFADSSAIPTYYVSQITRDSVTVALTGDGGDESFAGYDRYRANALAERMGKVPGLALGAALVDAIPSSKGIRDPLKRAQRFLSVAGRPQSQRYASWMSYFPARHRDDLCTPEFLASEPSASSAEWLEHLFRDSDAIDPLDAAMSVDIRSYLPYDLLVKVDIASMANSLEARSPFLDHEVMEFAAALPPNLKARGRSAKYLLKKTFADFLPSAVPGRRKMGFGVPVGEWFRGPLRELLRDALLSDQALERGYFRPHQMRSLVDEHLSRRDDHSSKLWNLVMLEMWHREVVEKPRERLVGH